MKRVLLVLGVLVALCSLFDRSVFVYAVASDPITAAQSALDWLVPQQQADGSFPGFGVGSTADAVLAIVADARDPNSIQKNGNSPVTYLASQAATYASSSTAAAGKLALAVTAAGKDPTNFGEQNLIALIQGSLNASTGQYGATPLDQSYAMLGLVSSGQVVPALAITALSQQQLADGGWSFDGTVASGSDTNTTSVAVQALVAAGASGDVLSKALSYLEGLQNADGGFPFATGGETDTNSTAYVIQALVALGRDPSTVKKGGNDPMTTLLEAQNDNGSFKSPFAQEDVGATIQAIPALQRKAFPLQALRQTFLPLMRAA